MEPLAFPVLILVAAGIGHAALCVFSLNWLHGQPLPRWLLTLFRGLHLFLLLGGLSAFAYLGWTAFSEPDTFDWPVPLLPYLGLCVFLGGIVVPFQMVGRWFRRVPAIQLSNHTQTLDVAARVGFKPHGHGKRRFLTRLPGNQVFHVDLTDKTLRLPQLPASWDGLTILHISDLHLCGTPDCHYYEHILDRFRKDPVDLVAVTGDILDSDYHYHWIIPILSRLSWRIGAFAVFGNHDALLDMGRIKRRMDRMGIEMVGCRWQKLDVKGEPLIIIGNETPWLPAPDLKDCPREGFRLCLSHTPDNLSWARGHKVDLMLAGHNHGGQVRFPGLGSLLVPSRYGRRYDSGTFYEPPTLLHVSRGLSGSYPIRYGCRPEVTRLILQSPQLDNDQT